MVMAKTANKKAAPKMAEKSGEKPKAAEVRNEKNFKDNHIYHIMQRKEDDVWVVKLGGGKVLKLFNTQEEAIKFAKTKANNQDGSIVIHKRDGKIRKLVY